MNFKIIAVPLAVLICSQLRSEPAKAVCAVCHPGESAAFAASAMGQSLGTPVRAVPAGRVTQSESGAVIRIDWLNGKMSHRLTELGFHADYSIAYQIGAGKIGHSYAALAGDFLLQSPVSYYRRYGWDISPGFKDAAVLDFDRVLGERCLFCHSNDPRFSGKRRLASDADLQPIGCGRCHGDAGLHVLHPSRANIVNPARLKASARDGICEQCHLEGVARVLNPGKSLRDFHPGEELQATLTTYVAEGAGPGTKAVSQVEQLALSRCSRESGGKLWCGTCHDPHGAKKVTAVCESCHPKLSAANHPGPLAECVSCHMPKLTPRDVAHAASTDHRILARPAEKAASETEMPITAIRAWREPDPELRVRNLGLAEMEISTESRLQALGEAGGRLLQALPVKERDSDPAVLAALGDVELSRGHLDQAEDFFRRACDLAPGIGEYSLYLGMVLKQKSDLVGAAHALQNAISADASLQKAYLELSALYARQGKTREAAEVLNGYLRWNPQSVAIRSALDGLEK